MSYTSYLRSSHWRAMRQRTLDDREHRCEVCGSHHALHVHHRTYDRLGKERLDDLLVLCSRCHELVHECEHARTIPLGEATDLVTRMTEPIPDETPMLDELLPVLFGRMGLRYDNTEPKEANP